MNDPLEAVCENADGSAHEQVQWCEAWGKYLCSQCRYLANENELRLTLAQRQAMTEAGRG